MLLISGKLRAGVMSYLRPRRLEIIWDKGKLSAVDPAHADHVAEITRYIETFVDGEIVVVQPSLAWDTAHLKEALPTALVMEEFIFEVDDVVISGDLERPTEGLPGLIDPIVY